MARRSSRIMEAREKTELNCMSGLLSILQSCQGLTSPKLISNGRPASRHVTADHPRKVEQLTSFDEECRRIQDVDVARVSFNGSSRSMRNLIQEDLSATNSTRQMITNGQERARMDSALFDDLVNTHKRARKKNEKAYQPSLTHLPSTSAEISLNRLTLAALLEAVSAQSHPEEGLHSKWIQRSLRLRKYDQADPINLHQVRISVKAFADKMFIDRELIIKPQGVKSESKSLSNAIEALDSDEDRIMDLLLESDSLLPRGSKNFRPSQTERETVKSLLDAKLAEYKRENARILREPGRIQKGKKNKHLLQKIDYQCSCSPKARFVAQPTDKIIVLEPALQNAKNFDSVTCHCSSVQSRRKLSRMISDAKPSSFIFRGTKKTLKHAFGSPRKEPDQCSVNGNSDALGRSKSTRELGDVCVYCGVDNRSSFSSSTNVNREGKLCKKRQLKSNRACATDTIGKKEEIDVIFEAKRHLSERLKTVNDAEAARNEKTPRTLRRVLASPEHDFCSLSARRESQYCSGLMRMACLSPLRPSTMRTSCDDYKHYEDSRKCSPISSPDETHELDISAVGIKKSSGEPKVVETNSVLESESCNSEVLSEINTDVTASMQMTDTTELCKDDDSAAHCLLDSLSENEAFTSTADDSQSTPSSNYQLDVADNIKYQEEHQSPVSVLDPFFVEEVNSPQNTALETAQRTLQPLRLDFEELSVEPFPHTPLTSLSSCTEEHDHLSEYVHSVLQASCLDWDQLSKIKPLPEELVCASLVDEVEYLPTDCCFDLKLLFDHINEVLIDIHRSHFCSCPSQSPVKPKNMYLPLAKLVHDEVMTQADFYLLPQTERRTLDQLVSKDVKNSRSWLDVRLHTEQIVTDISEDILEECILDTLLESVT